MIPNMRYTVYERCMLLTVLRYMVINSLTFISQLCSNPGAGGTNASKLCNTYTVGHILDVSVNLYMCVNKIYLLPKPPLKTDY